MVGLSVTAVVVIDALGGDGMRWLTASVEGVASDLPVDDKQFDVKF